MARPHNRKPNRKPFDTTAIEPMQEPPAEYVDGMEQDADVPEVEPVHYASQAKIERMKFMNEMVEIMVHESEDPQTPPLFQIGVNAIRSMWMMRGMPTVVRRCFVEVLARAKETKIRQIWETDPGTGYVTQKDIPRAVRKYPFSVLRDDNPKGRDWLRQILAQ
jgi:hypothetical protein